jgi:serine/threonine protein kinase
MEINSKVGAGRFTLVRALGRGGMGEVWLAQDERLGESVALKFLPPEVRADPVALDDLRRETARSHRLSHPNIVRIHDLHEEPGGMAFIAMEYVDGSTLAGLRLQQPERVLSWEFLRPLVQQLCAALDYAHGEKVIHRDLKPANVMVDGKKRLKLADFGIAATVSDSVSRVSGRHATSGTLPYMSPQQLAGKRPSVADDIYALGATLYELLTSKPPFYTGDLTHQVLHEPPEPLDERLVRLELANPVPPDVAALIMACLAKDPAQRPQSARAVAEWVGLEITRKASVESLAEAMFPQGACRQENTPGEPSPAAAPAPGRRQGKPALVISGAAAVLLLVGIGAWHALRPRAGGGESQPPVSTPEEANANGSSDTATQPAAVTRSLVGTPLPDAASTQSEPKLSVSPIRGPKPGQATKDNPFVNSLGMKFVPVAGTRVLFSIWDVRVKDYAAYTGANRGVDGSWQKPGFRQSEMHPVVNVSWDDAKDFCGWLTEKEKSEGRIAGGQIYRLPMDAEWSVAVGMAEPSGGTPRAKAGKFNDVFPWGRQWPPPRGAGNYGSSLNVDDYDRTSPVGSFAPNRFGLYDMGGNVWQWCEDWSDRNQVSHAMRGASWVNFIRGNLLSSNRNSGRHDNRANGVGFRCVLVASP